MREKPRFEQCKSGSGKKKRAPIRTQRTALQAALVTHVQPGVIQLGKKVVRITDLGTKGVEIEFKDGETRAVDLVVGADGIRSVSLINFRIGPAL